MTAASKCCRRNRDSSEQPHVFQPSDGHMWWSNLDNSDGRAGCVGICWGSLCSCNMRRLWMWIVASLTKIDWLIDWLVPCELQTLVGTADYWSSRCLSIVSNHSGFLLRPSSKRMFSLFGTSSWLWWAGNPSWSAALRPAALLAPTTTFRLPSVLSLPHSWCLSSTVTAMWLTGFGLSVPDSHWTLSLHKWFLFIYHPH